MILRRFATCCSASAALQQQLANLRRRDRCAWAVGVRRLTGPAPRWATPVENPSKGDGRLARMARMSSAVSAITDRVRERVRSERIDVASDPGAAERLVRDELRAYAERSLAGSLPSIGDEVAAFGRVLADLTG